MKLAECCNSSTSYIGEIEIGNKFPSIEMIEKIANALQVQPYLFFQAGDELQEDDFTMPEKIKGDIAERMNSAIHSILKSY